MQFLHSASSICSFSCRFKYSRKQTVIGMLNEQNKKWCGEMGGRKAGSELGRVGPACDSISSPNSYSGPSPVLFAHIGPRQISLGFEPLESVLRFRDSAPDFCSSLYNIMEEANNETDLEINYNSEASIGDKRKREGKVRSKVWQHFTKVIREDGKCDKCQCNHCQKLFTCSSRSGTTHLLRHISEGICPVFKKEKDKVTVSSYPRGSMEHKNSVVLWKYEQGLGQSSTQQCMDVEVELLPDTHCNQVEDDYGIQTPVPLRSKLPPMKSQPKSEAWMNEFKNCMAKLVELNNGKVPVGCVQSSGVGAPDYSISAALKCLNEMEDIPQSSEMYLDAFEILQDAGERECFICLPQEPRRRWLQRVLHRRHPLRYASNM